MDVDEPYSRERLADEVNTLYEGFREFVGEDRDGGGRPGSLVSRICRRGVTGARDALKKLQMQACELTNRAVMLREAEGDGDDGGEGGEGGDGDGDTNRADGAVPGAKRPASSGQGRRKKKGARGGGGGCQERVMIDALLEAIYYLDNSLRTTCVGERLVGSLMEARGGGDRAWTLATVEVSDADLAAGVQRFSRLEVEDANNQQNLLLYLLNTLQERGMRRNGSDCYEKIHTEDGHDTHAWRNVGSVTDFVYDSARKEENFDQWLNLTAGRGNAATAAEHLCMCKDVQFPKLVRDRHVFSFSNGIYLAAEDAFVPYAQVKGRVASSTAACKYFDAPFDAFEDVPWEEIPTPNLQRVLDDQKLEADVSRWMYVFIGRLLYEVNERDGWQVIPYLKGQAGTGKSTILTRVCKNLYDAGDVGVLSNNVERKFGLSAFVDKYLFVAPEMKSDLCLEQAEFQSMVSGEAMQLNVKFKTAHAVDWKVPGIMAGNEVPGFRDNSGSIHRRIVVFDFVERISNGDMELGARLEKELPAIVKKSNAAYRWAVENHGREDVWTALPAYFTQTRKELSETTNSILLFVNDQLRSARDVHMTWHSFTTSYAIFCSQSNIKAEPMKKDVVRSVLSSKMATLDKTDTVRMVDHRPLKAEFIVGLCLKDDDGSGMRLCTDPQ